MGSMNKKIAVFIDWFRPGYKAGGPITSCANMVDLLKEDFHFYIFTKDRDYMEDEPYDQVASNEWINYSKNCEVMYLSAEKLARKFMKNEFDKLDVHVVYINGMFSKHFSIWPMKFAGPKNVIVAPRGMLRPSALAIKSFKKSVYLILSRVRGTYKNVVFQATTDDEKKDIEAQKLGGEVQVAHNSPKSIPEIKANSKKKDLLRICFAGRIAKEKNLLFALKILKEMSSNKIELNIAGEKYDEDYWKECDEAIQEMPNGIKVNVLGSLSPDRFSKELEKADVMFLPTRGENFGHVVHESLACGTPVIISDQTPWRGLSRAKAGFDLALQDKKAFREAINKFWKMGSDEYQEWIACARKFASERMDTEKLRTEYIRLFE
ncbi:MAG: glycosyltransferase [Flavobacteriales bacterium]|nr:glycosyltransferase [Flavobacteriales bacterium]